MVFEQIKSDFADGAMPKGLNFRYKDQVKVSDKFISICGKSEFKKFGSSVYIKKYVFTFFEKKLVLGLYTKNNKVKKYKPLYSFSVSKKGLILIRSPKKKFISYTQFYSDPEVGRLGNNPQKVLKYFLSKHGMKFKIYKNLPFNKAVMVNNYPLLPQLFSQRLITSTIFYRPYFRNLRKYKSKEDLCTKLSIEDCDPVSYNEISAILLKTVFTKASFESICKISTALESIADMIKKHNDIDETLLMNILRHTNMNQLCNKLLSSKNNKISKLLHTNQIKLNGLINDIFITETTVRKNKLYISPSLPLEQLFGMYLIG